MEKRPKKLLDQICDAIRRKHTSIRTQETTIDWLKRTIRPRGKFNALI